MRILLLGGSKSGKSMLGQRLTRRLADGGPIDRLGHPGAPGRRGLGHRPPPSGGAGGLGLPDPGAGPGAAPGAGGGAAGERRAVRQRHGVPCLPDVLRPIAGRRCSGANGGGAAGRQPARPAPGVRVRRDLAGRRDLRDLNRDVSPGPGGGVPWRRNLTPWRS